MSGTGVPFLDVTDETVDTLDARLGQGTSKIGRELLRLASPRYRLSMRLIGRLWVAKAIPLQWAGVVKVVSSSAERPIDAMRGLALQLRQREGRD